MVTLVIAGLIILAVVELILITRGTPGYYRSGIPVYRAARSAVPAHTPADWKPRLKKLAENEYAIVPPRAEVFVFFPLMRGVLQVDPAAGKLEIVGRLSWFAGLFTALAVVVAAASELWPLSIVVLVFDGATYWFQAHRYRQVLENSSSFINDAA